MGAWESLKDLDDNELQSLAAGLPETVLKCRAMSTTKKYLGAYKRWKAWATSHKLPFFPAEIPHVALYLQHLKETKYSKSAVEEAVNALGWVHTMVGKPSPASSPFVQTVVEGMKRELAMPVHKKLPFTVEMLNAIVVNTKQHCSLANLRLASACLLAFAGFLRFDELANIKVTDLTLGPQHLTIQIPQSKTDQLRQGCEVVISRTGSATCPVAMLEAYMKKGGICLGSDAHLFRPIVSSKSNRLRDTGCLTYSRMRELLKAKLDELGFPSTDFSLHSLRSGGATAAARAGVRDRDFQPHGRWKSVSAKDGYVEDSLEKRLKVSQSLGL